MLFVVSMVTCCCYGYPGEEGQGPGHALLSGDHTLDEVYGDVSTKRPGDVSTKFPRAITTGRLTPFTCPCDAAPSVVVLLLLLFTVVQCNGSRGSPHGCGAIKGGASDDRVCDPGRTNVRSYDHEQGAQQSHIPVRHTHPLGGGGGGVALCGCGVGQTALGCPLFNSQSCVVLLLCNGYVYLI